MEFGHIITLLVAIFTPLSAVIGWVWVRMENTKTTTDKNATRLDMLEVQMHSQQKQIDSLDNLPERIAKLETTVDLTGKNLQHGMQRIEAYLVRMQRRSFKNDDEDL